MLDQPITTAARRGAQLLETLGEIQGDSLLALIAMTNADPRPDKIDVGVGVYRDGVGGTPIPRALKAATVNGQCLRRRRAVSRIHASGIASTSDGSGTGTNAKSPAGRMNLCTCAPVVPLNSKSACE